MKQPCDFRDDEEEEVVEETDPVRLTVVVGFCMSFVVRVNVADFVPADVGEKYTTMLHEDPVATIDPHALE